MADRDIVRVPVPVEQLDPWIVWEHDPITFERVATCAECGWDVDPATGLWKDRDVHFPKQVGQHCVRCGRRWFFKLHQASAEALAATRPTWTDTKHSPAAELLRFPQTVAAQGEVLPAAGSPQPLAVGRPREPRVMDAMRRLADDMADEMVAPFREGLQLKPDVDNMTARQLLDFYSRQGRLSERIMDRVIGTPVARNANINADLGKVAAEEVSARTIDETIVGLLNGDLQIPQGD